MTTSNRITPLRQRMIEDMSARNLGQATQRGHIYSCKLFAGFLKRSPDTATADDLRRFQLHLIEAGHSICNRNRIMTGVRFLFRITLRRHDLAAEIFHQVQLGAFARMLRKEAWRRGRNSARPSPADELEAGLPALRESVGYRS